MSEHAAPVQAVQAPAPQLPAQNGFHLQRKCACGSYDAGGGECDKCRKDGTKLQRTAVSCETPEGLPSIVHDVLASSGQPLDASTRAWMEPRFGHDFSSVRVHTDARAAESTRAVNALAYTVGHEVVFGAGRYAPNTERGSRLLAHELTHVVQQSRGGASAQQAKAISEPSDAAEIEADATANRVMNGGAVQISQAPTATLHALSAGETAGVVVGSVLGGAGLILGGLGLAGVFDRENYSDTELTEYLTVLATTHRPEKDRNSDNKARDVVRRWRAGASASESAAPSTDASASTPANTFNIDNGFSTRDGSLTGVELKRLLIEEMLSGVTAGEDEHAILTILENSAPGDIVQILDPNHRVSVQELDDKIGGDNHARLEAILEQRFPRSSEVRRDTAPSCTARQSLMIEHAKRQGLVMVNNAIEVLTNRSTEEAVRTKLQCRFEGAGNAEVARILEIFQRAGAALGTRLYHCGPEGGVAELEAPPRITATTGEELPPVRCDQEEANSFLIEGESFREVYICGVFFRRNPEVQAITLLHEAVHGAGVAGDPAYQPGCGLNLQVALSNPDSYAFLAADLMSVAARSSRTQQIQRKATSDEESGELPEVVEDVLYSSGQPLDATTRAQLEPRFNRDFGQVRVHTDSSAAQSARAVNAHAYTVGQDVVFGPGQYEPGTEKGARLLAHELTHVVQQADSGPAKTQTAKPISEPDDAAEVEADSVAEQVISGDNAVEVNQSPSAALHAELSGKEKGFIAGGVIGLASFIYLLATGAFDTSRFRHCSQQQQDVVNAATKTAQQWIDTAITRVDAVLSKPQQAEPFVVDQLWEHFKIKPDDREHLNRVRQGLGRIQAGFSGIEFECESECKETEDTAVSAYVSGFLGGLIMRSGRLHVCPRFFRGPQDPDFRRNDEQPETIAHEMGHRFIGVRGDVYRVVDPRGYSNLTTEEALENADSYAQFARAVFNIGSRNAAPASQTATPAAAGAGGAVQRKAIGRAGPVSTPPIVDEVVHSPGEPLDTTIRSLMEPRFRRDFSDVRVHHDQEAEESARAVNAVAYTVGPDVVFGAGEYAPHTERGAQVLAHELTHVAQQANGSNGTQRARAVSHPSDAAEVEADTVVAGMMSGYKVPVTQAPSAALHTLSPGETAGLIAGGAAVGVGFGIAALLGAFESSKFDNCPEPWQKKALTAMQTARGWVDAAVSKVDALVSDPKNPVPWVKDLLTKHFKIEPTDKRLGDVRDTFGKIQSKFNDALYECLKCSESEKDKGAGRTISLIGPYLPYGRIGLCNNLFEKGEEEHLAETIVHELVHRYGGITQMEDEVYRSTRGTTYNALPTEMALKNADSYAQFAKDLGKGEAAKIEKAKAATESEGGEVKRKALSDGSPGDVPASVHEVLHSPGLPLDQQTRDWAEPRFEREFSHVKVHTDTRSAESAHEVNAAAYTVGNDVVFGPGRYEPETPTGRELLGHELTHVIQQESTGSASGPLEIGSDSGSEHEADRLGRQAAHGDAILPTIGSRGSGVSRKQLQRQPETETPPTPEPAPAPESQPAADTQAAPETQPEPETQPTIDTEPVAETQPEQTGGIPQLDPTSGMGGYPQPQCPDVLWAREYERAFRLDTISVIGLGAKPASEKAEVVREARKKNRGFQVSLGRACTGYENVKHPFRVNFYYVESDPRTPDREKIETEDAKKNRALADSLGATSANRVLIYVERNLESQEDFVDVKTLDARLKEVIEKAGTSGVKKGAKTGAIVGGILGGLTAIGVGIGAGLAIAGGGAALGTAIGAGIGIGLAAGGLVLGLSAGLGALFGYTGGNDRGTEELSKDRIKQVVAFVGVLRAAGEVKGKELTSSDADNLARDAVTLWIDSPATLPLTVKDRRLLIKVMLDGPTLDDDERAIIKLLENSIDAEVLQILDSSADEKERVTFQDLDSDIHGDEWQDTKKMLAARFPELGEPAIEREGKADEGMCDSAKSLQIVAAINLATMLVQNGSQRLKEFMADPKAKSAEEINTSVQCYFKGATPDDVTKIAAAYDNILTIFTSRKFACLGNQEVSIPLEEDDPTTYECNIVPETAISMVYKSKKTGRMHADRTTYFCPKFFDQGPQEQALTVIHEWVHQALRTRFDSYVPKCDGLGLGDALVNPDSFAFLTAKLWQGGGGPAAAGTPTVTIGGFRNSGSPTPENRCVSSTQIPTLGVDPASGMNFMELRGDIAGHRADAFYDFKRTKEVAIWGQLNDGTWNLGKYEGPGTLDDISADDEDAVPKFNQIYSIDGPGVHAPLPSIGDETIKAGVYKGSFVESVNVKVGDGPWTPSSNQFAWHSLTTFERGDDGLLRRTPKNNEIEPGAITVGNSPPNP